MCLKSGSHDEYPIFAFPVLGPRIHGQSTCRDSNYVIPKLPEARDGSKSTTADLYNILQMIQNIRPGELMAPMASRLTIASSVCFP